MELVGMTVVLIHAMCDFEAMVRFKNCIADPFDVLVHLIPVTHCQVGIMI